MTAHPDARLTALPSRPVPEVAESAWSAPGSHLIGAESLVAAGALVTAGTIVPPRSLVAGVPAKVRRELSDEEVAGIRHNAEVYLEHLELHRGGARI